MYNELHGQLWIALEMNLLSIRLYFTQFVYKAAQSSSDSVESRHSAGRCARTCTGRSTRVQLACKAAKEHTPEYVNDDFEYSHENFTIADCVHGPCISIDKTPRTGLHE